MLRDVAKKQKHGKIYRVWTVVKPKKNRPKRVTGRAYVVLRAENSLAAYQQFVELVDKWKVRATLVLENTRVEPFKPRAREDMPCGKTLRLVFA